MGNLVLRGCREKEESEVEKAHREPPEGLVKRSVCLNINLRFINYKSSSTIPDLKSEGEYV